MGNLLRAQLRRTFRGRLFWVELAAAALLALTILLNGYFGTNLTNAYVFKLVARMFGYAPLMGVFVWPWSMCWMMSLEDVLIQ